MSSRSRSATSARQRSRSLILGSASASLRKLQEHVERMTRSDWSQVAQLADVLAPLEGAQGCPVDGMTIVRHSHDLIKFPVLYGPSLVFVVQGTKQAIFGSRTYTYDHERYLVLTSVVPFVWSAKTDRGKPVLSVFVHLRADVVLELLGSMDFDFSMGREEELALFDAQHLPCFVRPRRTQHSCESRVGWSLFTNRKVDSDHAWEPHKADFRSRTRRQGGHEPFRLPSLL